MVNSRAGRPEGRSRVRADLIRAARSLFLTHGYAGVSARRIADCAGVSHAMVNYYFGSKANLFVASMSLLVDPASMLHHAMWTPAEEPQTADAVAARLVHVLLAHWDQAGESVVQDLIGRLLLDEEARAATAGFTRAEIHEPLRTLLRGADATRRATGIATAISGIIYSRYLLRAEPIASMHPDDVVRAMAPMIALQLRHPRTPPAPPLRAR